MVVVVVLVGVGAGVGVGVGGGVVGLGIPVVPFSLFISAFPFADKPVPT